MLKGIAATAKFALKKASDRLPTATVQSRRRLSIESSSDLGKVALKATIPRMPKLIRLYTVANVRASGGKPMWYSPPVIAPIAMLVSTASHGETEFLQTNQVHRAAIVESVGGRNCNEE
jgi:hypothetical protein